MSNSQKKTVEGVHVSIRPEEVDSILGLKTAFDFFDVFANYVSSYLEVGWDLKFVIPQFDLALDVDFRQVRELWNQGLMELAVKGIHACPVVCTGSASNLMVLEVHGRNSEKALVFGRDWRAQCILQAGDDREQHFFTWPQSIKLPDQAALETVDIKVFGEGGKVTLPPSVAAGVEDPIRWLVPPWESPPSPLTPRLLDFLEGHFPAAGFKNLEMESDIIPWEEIFAHIAPHAGLMQTLLTPVTESEDYYRHLLREARAGGLQDQRLLLGLLWHAPLGQSRHEPNSLDWFKDLIVEKAPDGIQDSQQMQGQLTGLIKELSETLTRLKEKENQLVKNFQTSSSGSLPPDHFSGEDKSWPILSKQLAAEQAPPISPADEARTEKPTDFFINPSISLPDEPQVKQQQSKAMIDELARLEDGQKNTRRIGLEGDSLKAKIEAQRQGEIEHLRQLKNGKWW